MNAYGLESVFCLAKGQPRTSAASSAAVSVAISAAVSTAVVWSVVSSGGLALEQNGHGRSDIDGKTADGFQRLAPVKAGLVQIVLSALQRLVTHNSLTC